MEINVEDNEMMIIYNDLYDILTLEDFKKYNEYIENFMSSSTSIALYVAIARITKPYKEFLINRKYLIDKLTEYASKMCTKIELENILLHVA